MSQYNPPDLGALSAQVARWNAANPPGTPVNVQMDSGEIRKTWTRTQASILSGHSVVIWLDGIAGCYLLDRVTRRNEDDNLARGDARVFPAASPDPAAGATTTIDSTGRDVIVGHATTAPPDSPAPDRGNWIPPLLKMSPLIDPEAWVIQKESDGSFVAELQNRLIDPGSAERYAKLFTAAPGLLEVLRKVEIFVIQATGPQSTLRDQITAAIAAAESPAPLRGCPACQQYPETGVFITCGTCGRKVEPGAGPWYTPDRRPGE